MGWDFPYNTPTKASIVEHLLRNVERSGHLVLAHRVVGDHLWIVERLGELQGDLAKDSGKKLICLYLLQSDGSNWGYKDLQETMEPYHYDCPESFLEMATDFAETRGSTEWRKGVRAFHAERKIIASLTSSIQAGAPVHLGGEPYTVEAPYHTKGYWTVIRTRDGSRFKASVGEIRSALYAALKAATPDAPDAQAPEQMGIFV